MLGNDIVDLKLAKIQSNWRRKGYLNKIFCDAEQAYILSSPKPDELVWKLWSLKEAAYKIYNRQTGIRTFEPRAILCDVAELTTEIGEVNINEETFFTKTVVTSNYVHSIAALNLKDLQRSKIDIYRGSAKNFDYHGLSPQSVSHHGDYLALVDFS
ncbi:phosphopantetheinyl transferase (holo-ACP synthase) [Pedobacter sp. UYP30]|uniref:4'-phosphopantetheinyl transferase family protein n=1 Tax=Pedobacter sp. UYP30 TaxID=1756400 RepID=UPI003391C528